MAQALYRKWRSQTFVELVGQEHVVQTLRNAIGQDRIAHAYLFTGPRGVGKTSVARIMAKAVNCLAETAQRPCGVCAVCTSIADGSAVDVIEMDAASHTSVEDAREIIERVQFRPGITRYKVYIIDEVHMLSTAAFNALLKTLEEPPGHALFIMATTEAHKIPQTILSRCQKFVFKRHTLRDIAAHLVHVASEEGVELHSAAAESIARSATGSLRDALSILDQLMAYGGQAISYQQVRDMLGASEAAEVGTLVDALLDADMPAALRSVAAVADAGADLRQFTRDTVERLRALLLLKASGDQELLDVTEDELGLLLEQAARAETAPLLSWVRLFSALDHQLRTTSFGQLPLELAVVEALVAPVSAPVSAVPAPRRQPASSQAPVPPAPPPRTVPIRQPQQRNTPAAPVALQQPAAQPVTVPPQPLAAQEASSEGLPAEPFAARGNDDVPTPPAYLDEAPALGLPALPPAEVAQPEVRAEPEPPLLVPMPEPQLFVEDNGAFLLSEIEALWKGIINDVKPYDKMIYAVLLDVQPINVEANTLVLLAKSPFHQRRMEEERTKRIVERVLTRAMGTQVVVRCTLDQQDAMPDHQKQREEVRKDKLVRAAVNIFDADIVSIEPYDDLL